MPSSLIETPVRQLASAAANRSRHFNTEKLGHTTWAAGMLEWTAKDGQLVIGSLLVGEVLDGA